MFPFLAILAMSLQKNVTTQLGQRGRTFANKAVQVDIPPSQVWGIPEPLLMILEELGTHELCSMVAVCRFFWAVAVPLLWRSLPTDIDMDSDLLLNILPAQLRDAVLSKDNAQIDAVSNSFSLDERRQADKAFTGRLWPSLPTALTGPGFKLTPSTSRGSESFSRTLSTTKPRRSGSSRPTALLPYSRTFNMSASPSPNLFMNPNFSTAFFSSAENSDPLSWSCKLGQTSWRPTYLSSCSSSP